MCDHSGGRVGGGDGSEKGLRGSVLAALEWFEEGLDVGEAAEEGEAADLVDEGGTGHSRGGEASAGEEEECHFLRSAEPTKA